MGLLPTCSLPKIFEHHLKLGNQIDRVVCNPLVTLQSISAFKKFEEEWFTISVPYIMWSYWTHSTILSSSGTCLWWVVSLSLEDYESYKWTTLHRHKQNTSQITTAAMFLATSFGNMTLKEVSHIHMIGQSHCDYIGLLETSVFINFNHIVCMILNKSYYSMHDIKQK